MLARNEILQGRYRIVRQLGHGGMGAVYEATDERFGESVALKEIITENLAGESQKELFVRAFEREAKALAKARHECVPYVRDYFAESGRQFLVMELIAGPDLADMLEKRRVPFPVEDVLNWVDQLLDALDYLHNLQPPIIHRDIKPQNLKINERWKIKLLDFGISKSVDAANTISNQTFIGATINYSPIEQILPAITPTFREFIILKHESRARNVLNQNTDARCDIYAVGATVYHLLTNQLPVDAAKRSLEMWEGNRDPLVNPSEINPAISPAVSAFLLKAMQVERESRFSSAVEMRKALHAAANEDAHRRREATMRAPENQERERLAAAAAFAAEEERKRREQLTAPPLVARSAATPPQQSAAGEIPAASDEFAETIKDISAHIPQMPTEAFHFSPPAPLPSEAPPPLITSPPPSETKPLDTDPSLKTAPDTHPTGGISEFELTGVHYLSDILNAQDNERKNAPPESPPSAPVVPPASATATAAAHIKPATMAGAAAESRKRAVPLWILPIAALGFLVICGLTVAGLILINRTDGGGNTTAPANAAVPTPPQTAATATPEATPDEVFAATPTPTAETMPTPSDPSEAQTIPPPPPPVNNTRIEPSDSPIAPARTPAAASPVRTPAAAKTPVPNRTPPKTTRPKTPDPNCVYNNSC